MAVQRRNWRHVPVLGMDPIRGCSGPPKVSNLAQKSTPAERGRAEPRSENGSVPPAEFRLRPQNLLLLVRWAHGADEGAARSGTTNGFRRGRAILPPQVCRIAASR